MKELDDELQIKTQKKDDVRNIGDEDDRENKGLEESKRKAQAELDKKLDEGYKLRAKNTKDIISELGKKGGPGSSIHDVKINILNEEGKLPDYKTLTDEVIDEAAELFDKLFNRDKNQSYFHMQESDYSSNYAVNGVGSRKNARIMLEEMGVDPGDIDFTKPEGLKLEKALFIKAIADKKNKITLEAADERGEHKIYEIKFPGKTPAQTKRADEARALVEEDKKRYNGIKENQIPGFVMFEKELYDSRNEIASFSFNSEEARNNPKYEFIPAEMDNDEYQKAADLYRKITKKFNDQKIFAEKDTTIIYKPPYVHPYAFRFHVNGEVMNVDDYLNTFQKPKNDDTFYTDDDRMVATIYLMTRYDFQVSGNKGKFIEFPKITPDMEPPKNIVEDAGRIIEAYAPKESKIEERKSDAINIIDVKEDKKEEKLEDKKEEKKEEIKEEEKIERVEKIIPSRKLKNDDIIKYNVYAFNAVRPDVERTPEMKIDAISEVMAAHALKTNGTKYDEKKIKRIAKHFKELYCLDDFKNDKKLNVAVANIDNALKFGEAVRRRIYSVKTEQYKSYADEMKELLQSMQGKKGRSDEYKQLYDAIKEASELQETALIMTDAEKATAYRNSTIQVVEAVKKYIKGKKSARVITSRKDRFDNALDALAIVEKANPNSAVRIDKMIADINKHRNVDKKINGDTFTTTYGAERAKARAAQQQKKTGTNQNTEVKKVNKTISM